jgi:hypothetical protein
MAHVVTFMCIQMQLQKALCYIHIYDMIFKTEVLKPNVCSPPAAQWKILGAYRTVDWMGLRVRRDDFRLQKITFPCWDSSSGSSSFVTLSHTDYVTSGPPPPPKDISIHNLIQTAAKSYSQKLMVANYVHTFTKKQHIYVRTVARGWQVGILHPLAICKLSKTDMLISLLKDVQHPTTSTCYRWLETTKTRSRALERRNLSPVGCCLAISSHLQNWDEKLRHCTSGFHLSVL